MSKRPFLVIRAQIDPSQLEDFEQWYREVHLPNVLKIPGIVGGFRCWPRSGYPNHFALYKFRDDSVIEAALGSPEALRARASWSRWTAYVREMSVEVYAQLAPTLPLYYEN